MKRPSEQHVRTLAHPWDTRRPALCRYVQDGKVFSLISSLPSSLSANDVPSLFEGFIGTMPLCDSSETYTRAVWPEPSPAVLRRMVVAGIPEFARVSCMKYLGVSGVFDYA